MREMRKLVRGFVDEEVIPLEQGLRRDGFVAMLPRLLAARERAKQTGLFAAHVPEEFVM
ncbi:MAG: acyl-CoA dehydrogenase family protein [Deltaproteobacteria bacterium]|nr:acyl-CoA dehydrogenase family protein [Deltaproteobacteria bacterium]